MAGRLYAPQPHTPQALAPTRYARRVLDMAIVTPIWEESLKPTAQVFVKRSLEATAELPHWFVAPESLDTTWYARNFPDFRIKRFPDHFFRSSQTYSQLLINPRFYRAFDEHEFITICQTDAVLIANPALVNMDDLDYLGPPWNPPLRYLKFGRRLYVTSNFGHNPESRLVQMLGRAMEVGNGGLSIRRVSQHNCVTQKIPHLVTARSQNSINEDALLCAIGPSLGLRVASREYASLFFLESQTRGLSHLPAVTGFHGLETWAPALVPLI